MNSFLYRIAQAYFTAYQSDISNFTFVFPNRRAGIFFQRYISNIANKPIFSPEIITINECFSLGSSCQTADRLSMLFRLYRIFKEQSDSDETFDSFVFWGEMLLSDFEDVDKYLVDVKQLFTNVTELKEIDRLFNVFTEKQIEAIQQFWKNFIPVVEGKTQEEFIATWKILLPIYEQFRAELLAENTATEAMICRDVATRLHSKEDIPEFYNKKFVFIGFNALNPCERTLMAELQKRNQADFYWDYEAEELRDADNPASLFYAENTHFFPSQLIINPIIESLHDKKIELIAVSSAIGQSKQTYAILDKIYPKNETKQNWIDTSVILPDENLLIPLLYSLPEQIEKVNVTMGFPLNATPISGLIEHIFELRKRVKTNEFNTTFYHQSVSNILNHQYVSFITGDVSKIISQKMVINNWIYVNSNELKKHELLERIFEPNVNVDNFLDYLLNIISCLQKEWKIIESNNNIENDIFYQYYITINRMIDIMNSMPQDIDMNLDTLIKLIRQLTTGISIPFIGEPLDGLQIMGVLETRGLDFENIIITSFNEGVYPKKSASNSFIPYNLRRGFGLPTYEHQDAITSYNFYRLIHHAKNIFLIYDSRTEGVQTGEVSRFIHQLNYHYGVNIKHKTVSYDISFANTGNIQIEKTQEVMKKLAKFLSNEDDHKSLSASSIKSYIDCPLQFYLTQVEEVEHVDEVKETIEENMFGNLFHATMDNIYKPYKGKIMQSDDFDQLIANSLNIDNQIRIAFADKYFKKKSKENDALEGNNLLIARVLRKYIIQILKTDKKYAPFRYIDSELKCKIQFPISYGNVNIKGFIDRIDEKENKIRILDYKTGGGNLDFRNWEEVFQHNNEKRPKYVLQTFLYGILYKAEARDKIIVPGIYYMRNIFRDDFSTEMHLKPDSKTNIIIDNFEQYEEEFQTHLSACLEDIFNPEKAFVQTTSLKPCEYCPYSGVCNRQ